MGHSHGPTGSAAAGHRRALTLTLLLSTSVLIGQFIGGVASGSLALMADAAHTLADVAGIALALLAIAWARRPAPPTRTFGRYRVEVLSAGANGLLLLALSTLVVVEALRRWQVPHQIDGGIMLAVAAASAAANLVGVLLLRRGARESLTVKGAYLEVLGDLLGSIGVVIAAVLIFTMGWGRADVIASLMIAALIVPRALLLLRDTWRILAEAVPEGVELGEIREHMMQIDGVLDVHDLHAWTITSGMPVLSAHVVIAPQALDDSHGARILDALGECLRDCFDVDHCTFQLEPPGHAEHEGARHP